MFKVHWYKVHWAFDSIANSLNIFLFKVQKTLEGLLEHYSGEFLRPFSWYFPSLHLQSSSLFFSFPSPVGPDFLPHSGRHLHLVVVTDKTSRGEVAALVAKILTRCFWCCLWCWSKVIWWQRCRSTVRSGGWEEVLYWGQAGDGGARELCLTFTSLLSTSNRLFRSYWDKGSPLER